VHANVSLAAQDRSGLERLCRYILRPPLGVDRIERLADGRVRVGMWSDRTSAIELSPLELTEKLAALVPPFRANQLLYAGVLAGPEGADLRRHERRARRCGWSSATRSAEGTPSPTTLRPGGLSS
jgi:hypothetical protein